VVDKGDQKDHQVQGLEAADYDEPRAQIDEIEQLLTYTAVGLRGIYEPEIEVKYEEGEDEEDGDSVHNFAFLFGVFYHRLHVYWLSFLHL